MNIRKMTQEPRAVPGGKVGIIHVRSLEDVWGIMHDIPGAMLVLNFSELSAPQQQRAIDLLSGALYVNGGQLQMVVGTVYVSIPPCAAVIEHELLGKIV